MQQIDWVSHFIDFWVIATADLFAAFFALKWFESHKEDQALASKSMNEIFRISNILFMRFNQLNEIYKKSPQDSATRFGHDIDQIDRDFEELESNFLFWSFKGSKKFRDQYRNVKILKKNLQVNTVAQAVAKLTEITMALDQLRNSAAERLIPKTFWPWKNKEIRNDL